MDWKSFCALKARVCERRAAEYDDAELTLEWLHMAAGWRRAATGSPGSADNDNARTCRD